MRTIAAASLLGLSLWGAGGAWAACTVDGGGPIVDGSSVTCSGTTTTPVSAPTALGVMVTVLPGATIAVSGPAISLGDGAYVDAQAGSTISGNTPVVGIGKNGVVSLAGTVSNLSPVSTAVAVDDDSVVAIYGQLQGQFAGGEYFIYSSATTGGGTFPRYVSSAGHITKPVSPACPKTRKSEVYNEAGGVMDGGVNYASTISFFLTLYCAFDTVISNRGHLGKDLQGRSVWATYSDPANVDFRNEAGGVIDGSVEIERGLNVDAARGTNDGEIKGDVHLSQIFKAYDWPTAPAGTQQRFTNNGSVGGVTIRSGDFIQNAGASFSPTSTLSVEGGSVPMSGSWAPGHFVGTLQINGTQSAGCLQGIGNSETVGGVVELTAGAQLGIDVATGQTCIFTGALIGPGRFVKKGAGTQVLGYDTPSAAWTRPVTSYAGGTAIDAGTLLATRSEALGSGAVQIANNASLQLAYTASDLPNAIVLMGLSTIDVVTPTANIVGASGPGRLVKHGTGSLHALGALAQADGSEVRAGGLRVDGEHGGAVTVFDGATLGGGGTIHGSLSALAGSTLAPAFDADGPVLLHSGSLSLASGARLLLTAVPGGHDGVAVEGSVSLGGATLTLHWSGAVTPGTSLLLIDNDGVDPVQGTFVGLPQNALFLADGTLLRINYLGGNGNDVTADVINSDGIFASGIEP